MGTPPVTQVSVDPKKQAWKQFGALIRNARVDAGHTQESLAELIKIDQTTLSRIEKGGAKAGEDTIQSLASALELDEEELRFILAPAVAETLPESYRKFIRIERVPEKPNTAPMRSGKREEGRFPVYGLAACGALAEAIANDRMPHGEKRTTEPWKEAVETAKSKHAFVVEAEGESMLPTIAPGDELLVDPRAKLTNNCIALVQIDGAATVKRWKLISGVIVLTPDNPDRKRFPEKAYSQDEFAAAGGIAWRVVLARSTRRL